MRVCVGDYLDQRSVVRKVQDSKLLEAKLFKKVCILSQVKSFEA